MKKSFFILIALVLLNCKNEPKEAERNSLPENDTTIVEEATAMLTNQDPITLTLEQANNLAQLALDCINTQYPNKLNQTLSGPEDMGEPRELHPAFYGCFDWHSAVHAHWSLVRLLKRFPDLEKADKIKEVLATSLSMENIAGEMEYFRGEHNQDYERTYGWAWLLKLAEELNTWEDPLAKKLETNLQPLTSLIVSRFESFLPKLNYPVRVGEHSNTAFALAMAHDYATTTRNEEFIQLIEERAKDFYLNDNNCPISWEPSGFDFLSPCFTEIDIMRRILSEAAFNMWMEDFMPQLKQEDFVLAPGEVSDRTDGKLVHLDGLNFSRAWVLSRLADQYPEYAHLRDVARAHIEHALPNLVNDSYEGGHWLGTYAVYALQQ